MFPTRLEQAAPLHVAIVSKNPQTLGSLAVYLQRSGATTVGTGEVEGSVHVGAGASAIVVFPDDFDWETVVVAMTECLLAHPRTLQVFVTKAPQRFDTLCWPDGGAAPLVVPKPACGWRILDAIRAHLHDPSANLAR
jgi:hypothetical protein